jgi:hypothetical protein
MANCGILVGNSTAFQAIFSHKRPNWSGCINEVEGSMLAFRMHIGSIKDPLRKDYITVEDEWRKSGG